MMRIVSGVVWALAAAVVVHAAMFAQGTAPVTTGTVRGATDLSGFWGLSFDSRKVPRAKLLPTVTRAMIDTRARKDAHAIRWCNLLGTPFVMDPGTPLDIRQGTTAIIITPEGPSSPRYLYLNRQTHVSPEIYDPSTNGDSIAHWEGDSLVVDTIGFHQGRGVTTIPGGGFKTEKSHLVERYRLLGDASVLSVTFTWTDPKVFTAPHTYEFHYYRMPEYYEPLVAFPCNPWDEQRGQWLGDPAPFKAIDR